jgi:hypothetical protein
MWRRNYFKDHYWYLAPFIGCNNHTFHFPKGGEGMRFPLPFDDLPQTDEDQLFGEEDGDQQVLPPDGWSAMFGCFACGLVDNYIADDVFGDVVPKRSLGRYHSDGVCFCVEARCDDARCKLPAKWFVDISGATENDLQQRLRQGHFFGKLPCGHDIRTTLDKSSFQIYRVMNRLWSKL